MIKLPLVSFIVTAYNYEKYITYTLESIKNQTYPNIEIIIVDDCSSDNTYKIAEQFVSDNQEYKITLIKQEYNQGQMSAMLRGLKEAKGQFVCFIDSDDILMPEYAQIHLKTHLSTSVAFTSCQIAEIGSENELHTLHSISSPHCDTLDKIFADENSKFKILKNKRYGGWYWSPNSSAMFRKSSIEILLDYKNTDKWRICPDKFIYNIANLIGGSAIIYTPLLWYRRHSNNAGNCPLVTGDKKLHSDKTTINNIKNNIKIRPETIKFLYQEREKLGKRNTVKFILTVLLSYLL